MKTFHERKKERTEYYEKWVKGWKLRPCTACNGSGVYDHNGSPDCGACDGTGKERYSPEQEERTMIEYILMVGPESWTRRWFVDYRETPRGIAMLDTEDGKKIEQMFLQDKKL